MKTRLAIRSGGCRGSGVGLAALMLLAITAGAAWADDSALPSGTVVPVDGEPFSARLAGVKADGELIFSDGTMQRSIPANALVRWGAPVEPARGPVAVLTDGGLLPAEVVQIDAGQVVFESDSLGEARLPLESLAGIILAWPSDCAGQDRIIGRMLAAEGSSDRVLLANGDRLTGVVADVNGRDVRLDADGKLSRLPRDRVAAVVFNPVLRARPSDPAPRAWIGLDEGTQLPIDRLARDNGSIRFVPRGAGVNAKPWSTDARRLVFVQPLGGRAEYLSDRAPDGFRHVPYLDLQWPYHNDRNVLGGRLRASGRTYLKGLSVHSMARLTYRLDEPFDRFEAQLALDDAAGTGGNVRYHVYVDRRRTFSSEPVRGGDPPAVVRVDLAGAKRLDLVVDYGQQADQLDYANWLDARLIRPETPRDQIVPQTRRQTQSEPRP